MLKTQRSKADLPQERLYVRQRGYSFLVLSLRTARKAFIGAQNRCLKIQQTRRESKENLGTIAVPWFSHLAAGEGFEPSHTESESAVLPLHKPAMKLCSLRSEQILLYRKA